MADGICFTSVFCVVCIFSTVWELRINATELSSSLGTCDSEDSEDGFCESKDENKYLGTDSEISDEEFHKSMLEKNEAVETSSEDLAKVEISGSEVDDSLSQSEDKEMLVTQNSTNEWLGLQIPVVDGVRVSLCFVQFLKQILVKSCFYLC